MKDFIKDALIAHYARNEDYHDSKDTLVSYFPQVAASISPPNDHAARASLLPA
jgi:hypothetical protein